MELLSLLESDATLRSFFNAFLAHPIFPVSLVYDSKLKCIVERAKLIAASREAVAAWVTQERYACFRRSRLCIQYRLFEQLWRADGAIWAGDAHVALRSFRTFLGSSVGGALVDAWEELQFCKDSMEKAWLTEAKQRCLSALPIPFQPHEAGSATWMEVWEACALERLRSYWVPSYMMSRKRVTVAIMEDPSPLVLHTDPCRLALQEEGDMGQPLHHFLQRHGTGDELSALKVWKECLQFRNLESIGSPFQTLEHSFSLLWVHIRTTGCPLIHELSVAPEALWYAVKAGSWNEVCCMLHNIQEQLFPTLKRAWSSYVLEDHVSYGACFRVVLDEVTVPSRAHFHPIPPFSKRSGPNKAHLKAGIVSNHPGDVKYAKVRKRIQPRVVSSNRSDVPESPIEALGDMNTLGAFEEYVMSNYNPLSQVCLAYQLWYSILRYHKLPSTKKAAQNRLAVQIYRAYLKHDSPKRVELPEHTVAQIPCYVAHYTPDSSTLRTIQMAAADIFAPAIPEFFQREEDEALCPSLPVLDTSTNNLKDKTLKLQLPLPTSEDAEQLTTVLELSGGPPSQQLKNFASFLQSSAATTGITDLLYFWLETHRLKGMFKEGIHMTTLWCKAEALLNKFPDVTSLAIAIPSSLVQQLQRAGEELRKLRSPQGFECFCEVLTQVQEKAFGEMLPHWRAFCCLGPQQNAVTSKVTLPKIMSKCPPGRKIVTSTSTTAVTGKTSLLTYSELKGVEWKAPIDS